VHAWQLALQATASSCHRIWRPAEAILEYLGLLSCLERKLWRVTRSLSFFRLHARLPTRPDLRGSRSSDQLGTVFWGDERIWLPGGSRINLREITAATERQRGWPRARSCTASYPARSAEPRAAYRTRLINGNRTPVAGRVTDREPGLSFFPRLVETVRAPQVGLRPRPNGGSIADPCCGEYSGLWKTQVAGRRASFFIDFRTRLPRFKRTKF